LPDYFCLDGAIYLAKVLHPLEEGERSVDIDLDFLLAEKFEMKGKL
jgi:hypothetical protein